MHSLKRRNWFNFQIIDPLIESRGIRLTWFDCKLLLATKNVFSISCTEIANSSLFSVELSRITYCMILSTHVFLQM